MIEGVGITPAPGARVEGRRLFMSPEELRELDWTAQEEPEKVELFKNCLYTCLDPWQFRRKYNRLDRN